MFLKCKLKERQEHQEKRQHQQNQPRFGHTLEHPEDSMLRKWLDAFKRDGASDATKLTNPDPNKERQEWERMAWQVFERKCLLLAAARDLELNNVEDSLQLAATDIFVEKAQLFLDSRGRTMYWCGIGTAAAVLIVLGLAAVYVFTRDVRSVLHIDSGAQYVTAAYLTVVILKATTAGGFVVGIAYFLASLTRALLHAAAWSGLRSAPENRSRGAIPHQ
jgi:hypothetical protein